MTSAEPRRGRRPVVLLDVMDTLVVEPYWTAIPAFFGKSLAELQAVQDPTVWVEFELGAVDEATLCRRFFQDRRAVDRAGLVECVRGAYRWVEGMEELLGELAEEGHELHALSNYPVWYRHIEERLGLSRFLDWSFVSCDLGVRKPDPRVFRLAAERLGVAPKDCLFVDDREANCAAARGVGMEAERFRTAPDLRARLVERGLLDA